VRRTVAPAAGGRGALAVAIVLAVAGIAGCGGGRVSTTASAPPAATTSPAATTAAPAAPAAHCRAVPRRTVRVIASHANPRTRFAAASGAAVPTGGGYAVSLVALAGGRQRMGTWFVDDLHAPRTVTSANAQALAITNWPLETISAEPARESGVCAARNARGPGPLAP
jgi:hypothetical protein